jgi:hypothetical protein
MKYLLIILLFIGLSASAQRVANDSLITYHSAVVDAQTHALSSKADEVSKFYFFNGNKETEMLMTAVFKNYSMDFDVDSIVLRSRTDSLAYFGVVGKFKIDGAIFPGQILIVSEIYTRHRTVFLFIKEHIYTFYN